jgi:regulator of nucleoside diphosphate kinase
MSQVIIPEHDYRQLRALDCASLHNELDRADVVASPELPRKVVTMHARVRYVDETTGELRRVTLVYPHQADASRGRISVLAPVGAALLGLAEGDAIEWDFPHGVRRQLRVERVIQPLRVASCTPEATAS